MPRPRALTPMSYALTLALALTAGSATAADTGRQAELQDRLADRAAELRDRRIRPPKMGAHTRQRLDARIESIDAAQAVLARGETLPAAEVARLLGEPQESTTDRAERVARMESRVDGPFKLGALGQQRLEDRIAAERAATQELRIAADAPAASSSRAEALAQERAVLERRLASGPKVGQVERARMRDRVQEIDTRLAALEEASEQLQVTQTD